MHRSGTTWLAHMLCAGGDFIRIGEPLSVSNRQTILARNVDRWYAYIGDQNEEDYLRWYRDAAAFRPHPVLDVRRARLGSLRDPFRIAGRWASFGIGRAQRRRLIVHDPFAVFSTDWFVRRLGYRVIVTVRHPLAVVSSLKRLNWPFDFKHLLGQPRLMGDRLERYRAEMESAAHSSDIVDQGSLLWRIIYGQYAMRQSEHGIEFVRHEDLSLDPVGEFGRLFDRLDLTFDVKVRRTIERATSSENPKQQPVEDPDSIKLDSRANLGNWTHRLDDPEAERIVRATRSVAERFYPGRELYGEFDARTWS